MKAFCLTLAWVLAGSMFLLSGCGFRVEKLPKELNLTGLGKRIGYSEVYSAVLGPRCSRCHGTAGGVTLTNYPSTFAALARIKARLEAKSMPPGDPLSDPESAVVLAWISKGGPEVGDGSQGSGPDAGGGITLPPLAPTYASIRANILESKCLGCHHSSQNDIPSFANYESLMSSGVIRLNNPKKSEILARIQASPGAANLMPPSSSGFTPVSSEEVSVIQQWITEGAPR